MKLDFLELGGGGRRSAAAFDLVPPPRHRRLDDAGPVIRRALIVAGLFFGMLILFAFVAPISGAAVAPGEVTTSGDRILIQPVTGGVLTDLPVREGQRVAAGQVVGELNGVRAGAALEQTQARLDALLAQQARLIAQRDDADAIDFPPELTGQMDRTSVASAIAAETALFRRYQSIRSAERGMAAADSSAASAERTGAERQLALIQDELKVMRGLYAKGYARRTQVRSLERAAADLEAQTVTGAAGVAKSQLEQARIDQSQVAQTVAELAKVEAQLAQLRPALRVGRYDAAQSVLRTPVAGRIASLAPVGRGSVVGPGTTLMRIVPDGRTMVVEALVQRQDIDDVHVGSAATVRFTTANPHGRSAFAGRVATLSPMPSEQGYRAQVVVSDNAALKQAGVALQPGLPALVNIETQSRTLFDYLVSPLADSFSTAFREE